MADRIGVIDKGELILVEDKAALMTKLGQKTLSLTLTEPLSAVPEGLAAWPLSLHQDRHELCYVFDATEEHSSIPALLRRLDELGIAFKDLSTRQRSLEDIFVGLVHKDRA